jgi:hypothetical protein
MKEHIRVGAQFSAVRARFGLFYVQSTVILAGVSLQYFWDNAFMVSLPTNETTSAMVLVAAVWVITALYALLRVASAHWRSAPHKLTMRPASPAVLARVRLVIETTGVKSPPILIVNSNHSQRAWVGFNRGRATLFLSAEAALYACSSNERQHEFDAIVAHELHHIATRDLNRLYLGHCLFWVSLVALSCMTIIRPADLQPTNLGSILSLVAGGVERSGITAFGVNDNAQVHLTLDGEDGLCIDWLWPWVCHLARSPEQGLYL